MTSPQSELTSAEIVYLLQCDMVESIRQDVWAFALGVEPIDHLTPERAIQAALVAGADMRSVISRGESKRAKARIEEIMRATGRFGPSLRKAIAGAVAASTAAGASGSS